jgi:hypothetical protein
MNIRNLQAQLAILAGSAFATASSFAVGPTAGDLSGLTPDSATILTAVTAVAVVVLGVTLAIKGFAIVKKLTNRAG